MCYNLIIIFAIFIYRYEAKREKILLSTIPPMFEYYLLQVKSSLPFNEMIALSDYFDFGIRNIIPVFEIGNSEIDEKKQEIS